MTDQAFPFVKPATSEADMFIQWKGTDLCMDFYCPCGAHCHADGYFADFVRCTRCGSIFQLGTRVIARRVDGPGEYHKVFDMSHDGDTWQHP